MRLGAASDLHGSHPAPGSKGLKLLCSCGSFTKAVNEGSSGPDLVQVHSDHGGDLDADHGAMFYTDD